MTTDATPKVSEALAKFETESKKAKKVTKEGSLELRKFVAWSGDREVGRVTPEHINQYAVRIGQSGADSAQQRLLPIRAFLDFWKEQGWTDIRLASHLRPPRSKTAGASRAAARTGSHAGEGRTYLSQEGYDRLVALLDERKNDRIAVTEEIRRAMADKDFRENAPLDAAKDRQGRIEAEIRELEASLASAQILPENSDGLITRSAVGARMTLKEGASGKIFHYTLVDVREADVRLGRISTQSPVGQALLDRSVGEEVVIIVPNGTRTYIVQDITGS